MTKQPNWEFVANLGDVNVADYGGFIVYRDTTGVYPPEVEVYEANEEENGGTMYRFVLEPPRFKTCSHGNGPCEGYPNGCLDPVWHNEWFVEDLDSVASSAGTSKFQLLRGLLSSDPVKRAIAYRDIVGHFGCFEFDQYPVTLSEEEAQKRYASIPRENKSSTPSVQSVWDYLNREYQTATTESRQDAIVRALHIMMAINGRMDWKQK